MSEETETDIEAARERLADEFGRDLDPLAPAEEQFQAADVDPFGMFVAEVLEPDGLDEDTLQKYDTTFRQWREYMAEQERHPACPNEHHVKGFIQHLRADRDAGGLGNGVATVKQKLNRLGRLYSYWQAEAPFPHTQDYNPIATAREKVDLNSTAGKPLPRLSLEDLRNVLDDVTHYRKLAILATQLKLGARLGEATNIQLRDLHIANAELRRHFPNMGTHPRLEDRENAIYIPSGDERDGNKSDRPRVLPLDDELRRLLLRYLLVRPDNGEPWLFLTLKTHGKITDHETVNAVWREAFHPEYAETPDTQAVTSHFGRHWFTTWWRVRQDVNEEKVKYLRGDVTGPGQIDDRAAIDAYLHTYYEDVEALYRENVFKLNL